eukprot:m.23168 g.23168  ORF g.23168 m.23168 type:complete len:378 (-) comp11344_c0_seq1:209-1342(-)
MSFYDPPDDPSIDHNRYQPERYRLARYDALYKAWRKSCTCSAKDKELNEVFQRNYVTCNCGAQPVCLACSSRLTIRSNRNNGNLFWACMSWGSTGCKGPGCSVGCTSRNAYLPKDASKYCPTQQIPRGCEPAEDYYGTELAGSCFEYDDPWAEEAEQSDEAFIPGQGMQVELTLGTGGKHGQASSTVHMKKEPASGLTTQPKPLAEASNSSLNQAQTSLEDIKTEPKAGWASEKLKPIAQGSSMAASSVSAASQVVKQEPISVDPTSQDAKASAPQTGVKQEPVGVEAMSQADVVVQQTAITEEPVYAEPMSQIDTMPISQSISKPAPLSSTLSQATSITPIKPTVKRQAHETQEVAQDGLISPSKRSSSACSKLSF